MTKEEALSSLRALFGSIGWGEVLEKQLATGKAVYLHQMANDAYDEWELAIEYTGKLLDDNNESITYSSLKKHFPEVVFRNQGDSWEYSKGKLFSIEQYKEAQNAIIALFDE